MAVELIDKGIGDILAKIRRLRFLDLSIGFQGSEGLRLYPSGANVATVATFQEFGTQNIAARSFLRASMFEFREKIVRMWAAAYEKMLTMKSFTPESMLAQIGAEVVGLIERKIDRAYSWAKANEASTIKAKGFDYPLHDTELMAGSLTWAVRNRIGSILANGGSSG